MAAGYHIETKLKELKDLNVLSPTDGYMLTFDSATGLWIAALPKLDDLATPDDNTDLDATDALHGLMPKADKGKLDGIPDNALEALADLCIDTNFVMFPTNAGYAVTNVGSGITSQAPMRLLSYTGVNANSSTLAYTPAYGFSSQDCANGYYSWLCFDKRLWFIFNYARGNNDTDDESTARVQLKSATTIGQMAALGIGLQIDGVDCMEVKLETYGTERGEVDASFSLTDSIGHRIVIEHNPATYVRLYVDGVLKAEQTTEAAIPSGESMTPTLMVSVANGATGGIDVLQSFMMPIIIQER